MIKYNESEEMYLETIYLLTNKKNGIRSIDVAEELGYSKASISVAMKRLREKKYITVDTSGIITLTSEGYRLAESIYERHHLLTAMFMHIGADATIAEENACRIEHVISAELVETLRTFIKSENIAT